MRIGIIGTGRIAERFVKTALSGCKESYISCIYNPHMESAERFAVTNQISSFTNNLEEFMEKVDGVYIASPHETHYGYAARMLENGKHVLCEKPLALSEKEARELFAMADSKSCVLMEAVKTAYCPGFLKLIKIAHSGIIGGIRDVEATFTRLTEKDTREYQNTAYGGSFLEFGSYVLMPAVKLLGCNYRSVEFKSILAETGVDDYTKVFLEYDKGMAMGKTGLGVKSEGQLLVSGTKGYILAQSPWWMTKKFEVRFEDPDKREEYVFPYESSGLQYEVKCFEDAVKAGKTHENKNDFMTGMYPEDSIALAGIFEEFIKKSDRKSI